MSSTCLLSAVLVKTRITPELTPPTSTNKPATSRELPTSTCIHSSVVDVGHHDPGSSSTEFWHPARSEMVE
jgi:hypothetical protein